MLDSECQCVVLHFEFTLSFPVMTKSFDINKKFSFTLSLSAFPHRKRNLEDIFCENSGTTFGYSCSVLVSYIYARMT